MQGKKVIIDGVKLTPLDFRRSPAGSGEWDEPSPIAVRAKDITITFMMDGPAPFRLIQASYDHEGPFIEADGDVPEEIEWDGVRWVIDPGSLPAEPLELIDVSEQAGRTIRYRPAR